MTSKYDRIRGENIREYGKGIRHLAFLGRLYSDRTHFVYELLQNAEDAGAKQVLFSLHNDRLEFLHDGKKFDEPDVRGICGVGESTKPDDLTKIGKFGIGFKSVYAYTDSPEIHCGDEHFRIEHYVRPYAVDFVDVAEPWTTKFVFPFNTSRIPSGTAFAEIEKRLISLNVRTLLFLKNIEGISWETDKGDSGIYLCERCEREVSHQTSLPRKITVIGQRKGDTEEDKEESWLVFERAVTAPDGGQTKPVEIAYKLEKETIVPLHESPLFVFFATEKDTRLGFLVQGPYKTTPARDNIPQDDSWNSHLVKETGRLVVDSLQHLKSTELLTVQVLGTMPVQEQDFQPDTMFRPIYDSVVMALTEEELLPAEAGGFCSARGAKIGRGPIRNLLSTKQLVELSGDEAAQEGSSKPELQWLSGKITQDQTPVLRKYLIEKLEIEEIDPARFAQRVSRDFFTRQEDAWLISLYRFLLEQRALWHGPIRHEPFVRLEDGSQVSAFANDGTPAVYLPGKPIIKGLRYIKSDLLMEKEAREFFAQLGIREPDVVSEVIERVLPHYKLDEIEVTDEQHSDHISLIIQALQADSVERRRMLLGKLKECYFLLARNAATGKQAYAKPGGVYIRTPELEVFLAGNPAAWFLDEQYSDAKVDEFRKAGVHDRIRITRKNSDYQGHVSVKSDWGKNERGLDGFDPDCWVEHLDFAVRNPTEQRSLFIWKRIALPLKNQIRGTLEKSPRKNYVNSDKESAVSILGKFLIEEAWIPDVSGEFHKPEDISLEDLPEEFERDARLADQLQIKGNQLADLANKADIDVEIIHKLQQVPEELRQEAKTFLESLIENHRAKSKFPESRSANPERRSRHAEKRASEASEKNYEERARSVRTSSPNGDKGTYLRQNYTNEDAELVCQICEEEMPFRKRNGEYYFESIELFDDLVREHEAAHLALCPLCAAKFKEFIKRDKKQQEDLRTDLRRQITNEEQLRFTISLGTETGSIRFVEKHFLDILGFLTQEEKLQNP